jgi:hypothetical protein
MADYPEWVMKHKKKGTYVNYVNGKYYLYAAHSERVPGTKKVRRVSDGYIGRITEDDGLIPARDKVSGAVEVFDFGLPATALCLCQPIYKGFRRVFKDNADFVMAASILCAVYGRRDDTCYKRTWLCIRFPEVDMGKAPTQKQALEVERGSRMVVDTLKRTFGDRLADAMFHLGHVYQVKINGKLYLTGDTEAVRELKSAHGIRWEDENG